MAIKKVSGKSKKFSKSSNKKKTMKKGRSVGSVGSGGGSGGKRRSMRGGSFSSQRWSSKHPVRMSPTAKHFARMAKRQNSANQAKLSAAQAESGWKDVWTGPNYVKPTHYFPSGNLGNPNKIAASSSPASQPNKFKQRTGKNPGRKGRGYF